MNELDSCDFEVTESSFTAEAYVDVNREMNLFNMSEGARILLGTKKKFDSFLKIVRRDDRERLRNFILCSDDCKGLPHLSIKLSVKSRHSFGYAVRQQTVDGHTVRIHIFKSRRELLLSSPVISRYDGLSLDATSLREAFVGVKTMLNTVRGTYPREADELERHYLDLYLPRLSVAIIESLRTSPIDNANLVNPEAKVSEAVACISSEYGDNKAVFTIKSLLPSEQYRINITADNFVYLITCTIRTVLDLSSSKDICVNLESSGEATTITVSSELPETFPSLSDHINLMDLEELSPPSSYRLFISELICLRHSIPCTVLVRDFAVSISFELKHLPEDVEFHYTENSQDITEALEICRLLLL